MEGQRFANDTQRDCKNMHTLKISSAVLRLYDFLLDTAHNHD